MGFWVASIFISLVAGGAVESFFTGLGFDGRMQDYSSQNIDASIGIFCYTVQCLSCWAIMWYLSGRFGTGTTYYF